MFMNQPWTQMSHTCGYTQSQVEHAATLAYLYGRAKWKNCKAQTLNLPQQLTFLCQTKAWMDKHAMNKYIDLVLIPWKNAKALGVLPILILDMYSVHVMGNILNHIQTLGIEVMHIPTGCTYLCQSIYVGMNKSIKIRMMGK
jgi:hypothetical protein